MYLLRTHWEPTGNLPETHFLKIKDKNKFIIKILNSLSLKAYIRVRPRFFDQVVHETMYASCGNKHFFTKSCQRQTYHNYEQS